MSKKDYEKAAKIAREWICRDCGVPGSQTVVEAFVKLFRDEPAFNEAHFRFACMPKR